MNSEGMGGWRDWEAWRLWDRGLQNANIKIEVIKLYFIPTTCHYFLISFYYPFDI
jgi:hypothetical protein